MYPHSTHSITLTILNVKKNLTSNILFIGIYSIAIIFKMIKRKRGDKF